MSGSLAVTWQELSSASNKIIAAEGEIGTKLAQLRALVDSLGGTWQGAASGAYNQLYANWDKSAKSLFESLNGISQMLGKAATAYEQTETQIKSGFNG